MDRPKLDFARIKREVSVADVARRYGFELKPNDDGTWLHGPCRLTSHESKDSKSSFATLRHRVVHYLPRAFHDFCHHILE